MGEHTVGSSGAPVVIVALAELFASCVVCDSVCWARGVLGIGAEARGDMPFATKIGSLSQGPDADIFFDGVPSDGGVPGSRLSEHPVVLYTELWRVLSEEHGHQGLILGQFQCCSWFEHQPGTHVPIPGLQPGLEVRDVSHRMSTLLVLL